MEKYKASLPPYSVFDQIDFWMVAPNDKFAKEGIEKGDLLGMYSDLSEWEENKIDDFILINCMGHNELIQKSDENDDCWTLYFDSTGKEYMKVSHENYFKHFREVAKVMFILKCKKNTTDEKTFIRDEPFKMKVPEELDYERKEI